MHIVHSGSQSLVVRATPQQSEQCHLAANEGGEKRKTSFCISLRALTASSNIELACERDKAQFVFATLRGGKNIAAA